MEQTSMGRGDAIRKLRQAHVDWQSLAPHHVRSLSGRATALLVIQKQKTRPGLVLDKEPEFIRLSLPACASPRECCEGMKTTATKKVIARVKTENPSPGYIIDLFDGSAWLTQDGRITFKWDERGIWPTREEAEAAKRLSLECFQHRK